MANSIQITACDNELIILAYQWGVSIEVGRILSGNSNPVNVNLNIAEGPVVPPVILNGVTSALQENLSTSLPAGAYSLLLIGVNWGGPHAFNVNVNGQPYVSPLSQQGVGLVWNSEPIAITV